MDDVNLLTLNDEMFKESAPTHTHPFLHSMPAQNGILIEMCQISKEV